MSTRKLRRKYRPSSHGNNISGKSRIVRRALTHRREIDHGKIWYCVRIKVRSGKRAELALRAKGFDIFRPVDDRWRVYKHRCSDVSLGWLGPYIFVGTGRDSRGSSIDGSDGVAGVLGTLEEGAIAVRPELLQELADRIAGYRKPPPAPFKEGQDVLVAAGPFAELRGIVEEADEQSGRASVAIEMFGKTHVQELDFLDLKAA